MCQLLRAAFVFLCWTAAPAQASDTCSESPALEAIKGIAGVGCNFGPAGSSCTLSRHITSSGNEQVEIATGRQNDKRVLEMECDSKTPFPYRGVSLTQTSYNEISYFQSKMFTSFVEGAFKNIANNYENQILNFIASCMNSRNTSAIEGKSWEGQKKMTQPPEFNLVCSSTDKIHDHSLTFSVYRP
jgi:hypothetical protein